MINALVVLDQALMGIVIVSLQYGGLSRIYVIKFKGYDWLVVFSRAYDVPACCMVEVDFELCRQEYGCLREVFLEGL